MKKNDKILVLGATGLVGSNLLKRLKDEGYTDVLHPTRSELNLKNQDEVFEYFQWLPKYVFFCAAKVGGIKANIENPFNFLIDNLIIQNNVIEAAIDFKVKKFINLGSSCIYPKDYTQPLKEEYLLKAPVEPTNEGYAIAKIAGLKLCEYANRQFETKFISLMPCNLFGPGDHYNLGTSHVLASLIKKVYNAIENDEDEIEIWGSGKPRREFMYVEDLVDCMMWSIDNIDFVNTFINVGTGIDHSIIEMAEMVCKAFNRPDISFKMKSDAPDGMMKKCLDVTSINQLGWKSKIDLQLGIEKTIALGEFDD